MSIIGRIVIGENIREAEGIARNGEEAAGASGEI